MPSRLNSTYSTDSECQSHYLELVDIYGMIMKKDSLPAAVRAYKKMHDKVIEMGMLPWQDRTKQLMETGEYKHPNRKVSTAAGSVTSRVY